MTVRLNLQWKYLCFTTSRMSRCRSNSRKARLVKFNVVVWRFVINNSSEALERKKNWWSFNWKGASQDNILNFFVGYLGNIAVSWDSEAIFESSPKNQVDSKITLKFNVFTLSVFITLIRFRCQICVSLVHLLQSLISSCWGTFARQTILFSFLAKNAKLLNSRVCQEFGTNKNVLQWTKSWIAVMQRWFRNLPNGKKMVQSGNPKLIFPQKILSLSLRFRKYLSCMFLKLALLKEHWVIRGHLSAPIQKAANWKFGSKTVMSRFKPLWEK